MINPLEHISVPVAVSLADQHTSNGLARASLIDQIRRAEKHQRWGESGIVTLFISAGLSMIVSQFKMSPGLACLATGIPL